MMPDGASEDHCLSSFVILQNAGPSERVVTLRINDGVLDEVTVTELELSLRDLEFAAANPPSSSGSSAKAAQVSVTLMQTMEEKG